MDEKNNNCRASIVKKIVDYAFQGACFLHDLCYLSWFTKRKDCDDWFLHNMRQMCSTRRGWFSRWLCRRGARAVYSAVRLIGGGRFDNAKRWTSVYCRAFDSPRSGRTTQSDEQPWSTEQIEPAKQLIPYISRINNSVDEPLCQSSIYSQVFNHACIKYYNSYIYMHCIYTYRINSWQLAAHTNIQLHSQLIVCVYVQLPYIELHMLTSQLYASVQQLYY